MALPTENVVIYDGEARRRQSTAVEHLHSLGQNVELWVYSADPDLWESVTPTVHAHVLVDLSDVRQILEHANSKFRSRPFVVVLDGLMSSGGRPLARLLRCNAVTVLTLSSSRQVRGDHRYSRVWTASKQWRTRGVHKGFCSVEPPAAASEPPAAASEPPASASEPPASASEPPASASEPPASASGWVSGWLSFDWLR
jgi:hypothetical protein